MFKGVSQNKAAALISKNFMMMERYRADEKYNRVIQENKALRYEGEISLLKMKNEYLERQQLDSDSRTLMDLFFEK